MVNMMERSKQVKRGHETVSRVMKVIARFYRIGEGAVTRFKDTCYTPDIAFIVPSINQKYGCEVKGMQSSWLRTDDNHRRTSRLKLPREQLNDLFMWCNENNAKPLLVVELKTLSHRLPYIYFQLESEALATLDRMYAKEHISPNIWEIIAMGHQIGWTEAGHETGLHS